MRIISRPAHGALDYICGILLAASPWIFGFTQQHVAEEFAIIIGAGMVVYSLMTNYEAGVIRLIPFPAHMVLDLVAGIVLVGAWFQLAIRGRAAAVFIFFGVIEIASVFLTRHSGPMKTPTVI